jgi:CTP synthase
VHLTLIPYIAAAGELKTKPTQHSVRELMEIGIQPHVLICRTEHPLSDELRRKIALFTNVESDGVIEARDLESIYEVPLSLKQQKLDDVILQRLGLDMPQPDLTEWEQMVETIKHPKSGRGAHRRGGQVHRARRLVQVDPGVADPRRDRERREGEHGWLSSEKFGEGDDVGAILSEYDGLLIPGGFGPRGVEGMLETIRWAREHELPFFGICLGLQCAVIEFARNVCGLEESHSSEFAQDASDAVICLLDSQLQVTTKGGTMRLGAYPCALAEGSRAREIYGEPEISERHRHRFEVNNQYRDLLTEHGLTISGTSPDGGLVEMIEISEHPWFIAGSSTRS